MDVEAHAVGYVVVTEPLTRTSESYPAALELKVMIVNMPALLGGEEE